MKQTPDLLDEIGGLLDSYAEPCTESCGHSQCPLLRELHAIRIKAVLARAQQKVEPIVGNEREGENVGDLMDLRLN